MKKVKLTGVLISLLFFASCKQDFEYTSFDTDAAAVRFSTYVGTKLPGGESGGATQFQDGTIVSVGAGKQDNINYIKKEGVWTPAPSNTYLYWEGNSMQFRAFYPVDDKSTTTSTMFELPIDQSDETKYKTADYMNFNEDIAKQDNINLVLQRQTARVIVVIREFGEEYTSEYNPRVKSVNVMGFQSIPWKSSDASTAFTPLATPYSEDGHLSSIGELGTQYTCLVSPGATANSDQNFLSLTVQTEKATYNPTVKGLPKLQAGYSYIFNLSIGKQVGRISSILVAKDGGRGIHPGAGVIISNAEDGNQGFYPGFSGGFTNVGEGGIAIFPGLGVGFENAADGLMGLYPGTQVVIAKGQDGKVGLHTGVGGLIEVGKDGKVGVRPGVDVTFAAVVEGGKGIIVDNVTNVTLEGFTEVGKGF